MEAAGNASSETSSSKASSGKKKRGSKYVHYRAFKASLSLALEAFRKIPVQKSYNDIKRIGISKDASPTQIRDLYRCIYVWYQSIAPLTIPGFFIYSGDDEFQRNQGPVAVSIPTVLPDKCTFYIVEITSQIEGDLVLQFPVRHYDGYCLGFRVLYPNDNPLLKLWYEFGNFLLPRHLFINVRASGYDEGYLMISKIQIREGLLSSIFNYFRSFPLTERTSDYGKLLKDSLFFILAECQRFLFAQNLFFNNYNSCVPANPTQVMSFLIQDWQNLSFAILQLWLSELEESMGLEHFGTKEMAEKLLKLLQAKGYAPLITFRNEVGFTLMGLLESSFLLRLDLKLGLKIMMRANGFRKEFPELGFFHGRLEE